MQSYPFVALGLLTAFLSCPVARAESMRSGGTAYEKPAPVPVAATPPALTKVAEAPAPVVSTGKRHPMKLLKTIAPKQEDAKPTSVAEAKPATTTAMISPVTTQAKPSPTPEAAPNDRAPSPIVKPPQPASVGEGPHETGAPTIQDLVAKHAKENGVPADLAAAVVRIESRFNPHAQGGSALGLMQIKYATARSMGYAGGVAALFTPETNLHFGMKVLGDAYRASHGDLCMTLARYQSGHKTTHLSAANRTYCTRARSMMAKA